MIFPHEFSNENTIFYVGNTPDYSYYSNLNKKDYDLLYSNNWSFKEESIKYLNKDLSSLYEIIQKASASLHENFNIQITNCLTISRLAADIFLKKYNNNNKISKVPYINNMTVFNDIHKAYFGGITEVYIPRGTNLKVYDVNPLYPYASYGIMPGLNSEYRLL